MKLSSKLICYHLQKSFPIHTSRLDTEPVLSCPACYEKATPLQDGRVYLVSGPDFRLTFRHPKNILFLIVGASYHDYELSQPNLCVIPQDIPVNTILNKLQEIFLIYDQWNQSLIDSRLRNASIMELMELTDCIIPNPMMLIGMDFTIIASKKWELGDLSNSVLGSSENSWALVDSLKQDLNYEEAFYKTGYFYYPGNDLTVPALCVNISNNDKAVYRLMFSEGEAPLDDTFGFILEYLAQMVSHALSTGIMHNRDKSFPLHQIFISIMTDPGADYVKISQQLSNVGWLSSHMYQCILIQTGLIDQKNLTLNAICNYLENTIPASCATEYKGNAVLFINLDLCTMTVHEISDKIEGFIKSSMLNAGYSRKMLGHFNFHRQYTQASVALQVGKRKNPAESIHHFNSIALPYILEQATRKLPAYMICHEKLLSLKYRDEAGQSHLYDTLRCFLEHNQNIAHTANALFIHRTTLLYRLDKIRTFLDSDLTDRDEILYLLLSFHLMDMESENQAEK